MTEEKEPLPRGEWKVFQACVSEDLVNCAFGERGECQNIRHSKSGRESLYRKMKFKKRNRG